MSAPMRGRGTHNGGNGFGRGTTRSVPRNPRDGGHREAEGNSHSQAGGEPTKRPRGGSNSYGNGQGGYEGNPDDGNGGHGYTGHSSGSSGSGEGGRSGHYEGRGSSCGGAGYEGRGGNAGRGGYDGRGGNGGRGGREGNADRQGGRDGGDFAMDVGDVGEDGRRGARRGQRYDRNERFDLVRSRPDNMAAHGSKKGASGTNVKLLANFFPLKKKTTWCLYNYRVDYKPDEERTPIKKALLRPHAGVLGGYIFDGSTMWTSHRLNPEPMLLYSVRDSDKEKIELTVRLVQEMAPGDVTYLQFYNIIMRKCLQILNFEEIGRHFYDRLASIQMPHQRLELWPGYITTMRNHESNLMLCVEVIHKVLRHDTCMTILQNNRGGDKMAVENELVGAVVMTVYNRKTYKVDEIDWNQNPSSTFDWRGKQTSYIEYYWEKYKFRIKDLKQPLIISKAKKRDMHRGQTGSIILIPELCNLTGLSDQLRNNFSAMRELNQHLQQPPDKRFDNIQTFMRRLRGSSEIQEELDKWGLEFDPNLITVPGRILPKDQVLMVSGGKVEPVQPDDSCDWRFAFRNKHMFNSRILDKWVIIVTNKDATQVDNLVRTMTNVGRSLGFMVHQPLQVIQIGDPKASSFITAINQAWANYRENINILFIVLPFNKLDLYSAIKRRCCIDLGIASQCFLAKNIGSKGLMSIATKVVIQMNAKLGGEPWAVTNPLKASHTMVVGFDVHHCGKRKNPSVGAMVATTNKELSKYYSTVSFHKSRDELSENLCTDITKCLYAFKKVNDENLPDRIIMFRDGVGDGQLTFVYNTELDQIKTALTSIYASAGRPLAKFSMIVVTKKINTRLATIPLSHGAVSQNPGPGTIVDDVITLPERWDFFLISQHGTQGTVSPTSYNVIWDQQGLDPDKIQRFTYKLTHLYYNWSGTIAVPAPCQYAHKLAYLTGLALGNSSHERLSHLLYYL